MTTQQLLRAGRSALQKTSDAPDLDTERLLLHAIGKRESSWLYAHFDEILSPHIAQEFAALVIERATGKPLAYILGEAEFCGRPFYVNEHVLIPRPETEQLIDATLEYTRLHTPATIADIGTGSGCIAVTLALELPDIHIIATDISLAALEIARKNARRHGVAGRIEFLEGDMLEPLAGKQVDFIVSNPPYVPTGEIPQLSSPMWKLNRDTAGLAFEPRSTLDGGTDGQQFVNQIKTAGIPYAMEITGGKTILDAIA